VKSYLSPLNTTLQPFQDTSAFATCTASPRPDRRRHARPWPAFLAVSDLGCMGGLPMHRFLARRHLVFALTAAGWLAAATARAADGELDPLFAGDGVLSDGSGPFVGDLPHAVAVFPNQDLVVVGDLGSSSGMDHVTISANGNALTYCEATIPSLSSFQGRAVLVDRAGRLVVGGVGTLTGSPSQQRGVVGRFEDDDDCDFDTHWSGDGWQALDGESFCDSESCAVIDLAESPTASARLYALLSSHVNLLVSRLFVVRFTANGGLDTSFGVDGYAEVAASTLGTLSSSGAQLAVDVRGRPLVLASRWDPDASADADTFVLALTTDGDLDTTFGFGGFRLLEDDDTQDSLPGALAIAPNGFVGMGINYQPLGCLVGGLYPDGMLQGIGCTDNSVGGLALQGDGKLLFVLDNGADDDTVTLRMSLTPFAFDPTFGDDGAASFDVDLGGADWQEVTAMVLSTGRPVLVGRAAGDAGAGMFAVRLTSRYVFADGFESGTTSFWRR
jgi:hypothetical protein